MGFLSCLVLLSCLCGLTVARENRWLRFSQCELSVLSLQELKNYFGAIREVVQTQDHRTDVIILKQSVLHELPTSESCCFLRHLLRFYTENIFKNYEAVSNLTKREMSPVANAFLSIKMNLKQCHNQNRCSCGEESQRRYKLILEAYEMLDKKTATIKAFGEIDLLFAWMENFKN